MDERYLWDKSGPPDPDLARLEATLAPLAHDGRPLELPAVFAARRPLPRPARGRWVLAAASVAVVVGAAWWWGARLMAPAWSVEWMGGAGRSSRLAVGQRIVTGAGESARIAV